jgi:hypothetical protein
MRTTVVIWEIHLFLVGLEVYQGSGELYIYIY